VSKSDTTRGCEKDSIRHRAWEDGYKERDCWRSFLRWKRAASSGACVLISVGTSPTDRLGVVCFDSQSSTIFDSANKEDSELQNRLITLSARFAAALQIYKELQIFRQSQQQYSMEGKDSL